MAKAATSESVAAGRRDPQYHNAIALIRGSLRQKKDKISSINGELKEIWDKIEAGMKVDKIGARMFMQLDKLEPDERQAAYRAFLGMAEASDWPEMTGDLVDQAEGKELDPRKSSAAREQVAEEIDKEDDKPKAEPEVKAKRVAAAEAKAAAQRHLRAVPDPEKSKSADPDADLAGE